MAKILGITITYAHKKEFICPKCRKTFSVGTPIFIFNLTTRIYGNCIDYKAFLCKSCLDNALEEYKRKEGNYGEWLKRKIVKRLSKNS